MQTYCDHGEIDPGNFSFQVRYQIFVNRVRIFVGEVRGRGTDGRVKAVGHGALLYSVLNWNQVTKKNLCPLEEKKFVIFFFFFLNLTRFMTLVCYTGVASPFGVQPVVS
jgi:hypothetical protein